MTVFRFKLCCDTITILQKNLFIIPLLCCLIHLNAQDRSKITLRIEPGALIATASENLSILLNVEPKIKISDHSVIGMRFGAALNAHKYNNIDPEKFFISDDDNAIMSLVPTYDYFFNQQQYRPYLGIGIGYYIFSYSDVFQVGAAGRLEGQVKNQVGGMLRAGFEGGKTRIGLEYNLVPNYYWGRKRNFLKII